jgi:hypothetical protein
MTIMATHFAIVLGAWRLRVRIDIDEPRESELRDEPAAAGIQPSNGATEYPPHVAARGRG